MFRMHFPGVVVDPINSNIAVNVQRREKKKLTENCARYPRGKKLFDIDIDCDCVHREKKKIRYTIELAKASSLAGAPSLSIMRSVAFVSKTFFALSIN